MELNSRKSQLAGFKMANCENLWTCYQGGSPDVLPRWSMNENHSAGFMSPMTLDPREAVFLALFILFVIHISLSLSSLLSIISPRCSVIDPKHCCRGVIFKFGSTKPETQPFQSFDWVELVAQPSNIGMLAQPLCRVPLKDPRQAIGH